MKLINPKGQSKKFIFILNFIQRHITKWKIANVNDSIDSELT